MPSASILTKTSLQKVSNDGTGAATIRVTWDVETKYLDADVDFFDGGVDDEVLVIPSSLDGELYEVFIWVEDDVNDWGLGNGAYMGFQTDSANHASSPNWIIYRDVGYPSRGGRSGPVLADNLGCDWYSAVREFESDLMEFHDKCYFGVISGNPAPLAVASAIETGVSTSSTATVLDLTEEFDHGDCYDPATGIYTAPAGASLYVAMINGYITSGTNTNDQIYTLHEDGTEVARFAHEGTQRGHSPGCWGLRPCSAGDEITMKFQDVGGTRTGNFQHSVEFY